MNVEKNGLLSVILIVTGMYFAGAVIQGYFSIDLFLARAIQGISVTYWEETMEIMSFFGEVLPMVTLALALFGLLLWKKQIAACFVTIMAVLSLGINPVLKMLVDRPRPTEELLDVWRYEGGSSFPSGHAFVAVILLGLLYYLVPLVVPWQRAVTVVRLSLIIALALIGISRVYLGAHWPSDVIGGYIVGGLVLLLLIKLHRRLQDHAPDSSPIYT